MVITNSNTIHVYDSFLMKVSHRSTVNWVSQKPSPWLPGVGRDKALGQVPSVSGSCNPSALAVRAPGPWPRRTAGSIGQAHTAG